MWKKTFAKLFVTLKNFKFSETISKLLAADAVTAGRHLIFMFFGVAKVHGAVVTLWRVEMVKWFFLTFQKGCHTL